jgi:tRNA pseudouridine55 synthase
MACPSGLNSWHRASPKRRCFGWERPGNVNTQAPGKGNAVHGVVALDKPSGPTSFDVVAQVRRAYRTKAVGHAGTLDPLATGVLVVMLGEATKLSEYLTAADKEYVAEITFGRSTDTLDITGTTVESRVLDPGALTSMAIESAIAAERTRRFQVPPVHSAIKIAGQPAYARARRGESLELAARAVAVSELTIQAFDQTTVTLSMRVSKGYYVRSLVRDVCTNLGVPGCMSALRRTASGTFRLAAAASWPLPSEASLPKLVSVSEAVQHALPWGVLTSEGVTRARQGKRLSEADFQTAPEQRLSAWLDPDRKLVALGEHRPPELDQAGYFRVIRGFAEGLV